MGVENYPAQRNQGVSRRSFLKGAVFSGGIYAGSYLETASASEVSSLGEKGNRIESQVVTDSLGRTMAIPSAIAHIAPARPAAQQFLLAVAPDKLAALAYEPKGNEARARQRADEVLVGALFDRAAYGEDVSLRQSQVELLVDVENDSSWAAETAANLEKKTGVPLYTVRRGVRCLPQALADLGNLLGTARGEELAQYAAGFLDELKNGLSTINDSERPRVLFCNKNLGIEFSQGQRMLQRELIELAGGTDALPDTCKRSSFGTGLTPSDIVCDVIIAPDQSTARTLLDEDDVRSLPWASSAAVLSGNVHCFDLPCGEQKRGMPLLTWSVVGVRWLANILHPELFAYDMDLVEQEYFNLFFPKNDGGTVEDR